MVYCKWFLVLTKFFILSNAKICYFNEKASRTVKKVWNLRIFENITRCIMQLLIYSTYWYFLGACNFFLFFSKPSSTKSTKFIALLISLNQNNWKAFNIYSIIKYNILWVVDHEFLIFILHCLYFGQIQILQNHWKFFFFYIN